MQSCTKVWMDESWSGGLEEEGAALQRALLNMDFQKRRHLYNKKNKQLIHVFFCTWTEQLLHSAMLCQSSSHVHNQRKKITLVVKLSPPLWNVQKWLSTNFLEYIKKKDNSCKQQIKSQGYFVQTKRNGKGTFSEMTHTNLAETMQHHPPLLQCPPKPKTIPN